MLDAAYSDVEWIDPEVFSHLTRLETLHLEAGRLTAVDNLSSMTQLRRVYLQQNRLTQVVRLDALYSLVFIDLSHNRIAHVPAFWLDGLRHLQVQCLEPAARFTKYLTIILRLSYDNAKVTIDLRRTSNLQNILRRAQGCSCCLLYTSPSPRD